MPASTKQTADTASITFAALLHDRLFRVVPFATQAVWAEAAYRLDPPPGEYCHSKTLTHGSELRPTLEEFADQVAAGLRASYPNGFRCAEYSRLELMNRFEGSSISRAQTFGIAVAALAKPVGDDKMQLTCLIRIVEWQSK